MTGCDLLILLIAGGLWLTLAVVGAIAERSPPSPRPDLATGLAALLLLIYLRLFHGLTIKGRQHLAAAVAANRGAGEGDGESRGLIITANHAAGIDPLCIQTAVDGAFYIRWLAAGETIAPTLRSFVEFADVIFLSGEGKGAKGEGGLAGVREAVREVQGGGVVGIFPEGRIARRAGVITPFQPGVGLIIAKSRALVLPIVLRGVPIADNTYRSFFTPARLGRDRGVTVEFMPLMEPGEGGARPAAIVADLQRRYERWVGPVVPPMGKTGK